MNDLSLLNKVFKWGPSGEPTLLNVAAFNSWNYWLNWLEDTLDVVIIVVYQMWCALYIPHNVSLWFSPCILFNGTLIQARNYSLKNLARILMSVSGGYESYFLDAQADNVVNKTKLHWQLHCIFQFVSKVYVWHKPLKN